MDNEDRSSHPLKVVSWLLYGAAVVVMGLGLLGGLSIANAASVIPAATIGFQSPLLKPLWNGLVASMQLVGVFVGTIGFVLGLLIRAAGCCGVAPCSSGPAGATAGGGAGTSHTAAGASDPNDACPTAKRQPGDRRRRFGR